MDSNNEDALEAADRTCALKFIEKICRLNPSCPLDDPLLSKLLDSATGPTNELENGNSGVHRFNSPFCIVQQNVIPSENSSALVQVQVQQPLAAIQAPIVSSYNERIRPLLDAIDKLRHLKVMQEDIQLPTIVVVGDQSSGKSSVLESLAGISLPRGQGICTRVPLIMRLQNQPNSQPELYLEFEGKTMPTDESSIAESINLATVEIAGNGKGISNTPITLVVKKNGVPDLTMVDLPGITRVPVHEQPDDIYEQISEIIMEYIKPEESIVLNVLSATVDFPTCESIRMSQRVDRTGERTLAVVTKADKAPEGLLEKVTADDVNIGLGYVCVRNRIGNESYEDARNEEEFLFKNHQLLSKIEKSMVGIPVLAQKLVYIQATIISKCLPEIVRKINEKLNLNMAKLTKMPRNLTSTAEAMTAFMGILGSAKESLRKILLRGEFDEYPDENEMHCTARFSEMLNKYSEELQSNGDKNDSVENFLMEEIQVLEESKGIELPNFLPRTAFHFVLQRKVKEISATPVDFVEKVWSYIEYVVNSVLMHHSEDYPQIQSSTRRAASNLIAKMKDKAMDKVMEIVEMEKLTGYTCNPEYMVVWNKLMEKQTEFMEIIEDHWRDSMITIEGFGQIEVGQLRKHQMVIQQAFDMKMRMTAYWKIVLRRLVDSMALHLLFSVKNLVNKEMEMEIVNEIMGPHGGGIDRMLEELPSVTAKRSRLTLSIELLKESKEVVAQVMDRISTHDLDCQLLPSLLHTRAMAMPDRSRLMSEESDLHKKRTGYSEFKDRTSEATKPTSLEVVPENSRADVDMEAAGDASGQTEEMVVPEVDQKLLEELEALGFQKARAIRALHYSGNASLEAAVNWVVEHENDLDIDEMPLIAANIKVEAPKPSLTPEEMKIREQEQRERARKRKEEEEKLKEMEREERIRTGKEFLEAKRMEEENEIKRVLALRKAEKEEERRAREKIRQKLEEYKAERRRKLGLPPEDPAAVQPSAPVVEEKKSSLPIRPAAKTEQMRECLRSMKQNCKDEEARVNTTFNTLLTYAKNVATNPNEEKFRKIRLSNANFQARIGQLSGGIDFLELCGFEKIDGGEFLFLPREKVDIGVLQSAGSELNNAINNPFFGVL